MAGNAHCCSPGLSESHSQKCDRWLEIVCILGFFTSQKSVPDMEIASTHLSLPLTCYQCPNS